MPASLPTQNPIRTKPPMSADEQMTTRITADRMLSDKRGRPNPCPAEKRHNPQHNNHSTGVDRSRKSLIDNKKLSRTQATCGTATMPELELRALVHHTKCATATSSTHTNTLLLTLGHNPTESMPRGVEIGPRTQR